ncbi:hypothetical protein KIN20_032142 [Parelaphostrongylus tenuis]|uniref:Uncharacterized protein n=1 Tax=Parelaphostrongylus tenuis TaxID=148309 RepID=A0AAD5R6K5_PARTN|nr:hypothetical protein KIN20_032142 [Parelaphostrongylus tenuis]
MTLLQSVNKCLKECSAPLLPLILQGQHSRIVTAQLILYRNFLLYEYELGHDVQTAFESVTVQRLKSLYPGEQRFGSMKSCPVTSTWPQSHPASRQHKAACHQTDKEEVERIGQGVVGL